VLLIALEAVRASDRAAVGIGHDDVVELAACWYNYGLNIFHCFVYMTFFISNAA